MYTRLEFVLGFKDLELTPSRVETLKDLTTSTETAIRAAAIALLYEQDPDTYWDMLLGAFSVTDYRERSAGNYNMVGSQAFTDRLNTIQAEYGPGHKKVGPILLAFLEYRDKNEWLLTNGGDRISIARYARGTFLDAIFQDPDRVLRVCNEIDKSVLESLGYDTGH